MKRLFFMQPDTSQTDVTMICAREKVFQTQLTEVSRVTYQISLYKRQISAGSTATIQTLFWALFRRVTSHCDIVT